MRYILLLAIIFTLAFGASAARLGKRDAVKFGTNQLGEEVEGVDNRGQEARAKQGYEFRRQNDSSIVVIKMGRRGAPGIQVGTLSCLVKGQPCTLHLYVKVALRCSSSGCLIVGVRGGAPKVEGARWESRPISLHDSQAIVIHLGFNTYMTQLRQHYAFL